MKKIAPQNTSALSKPFIIKFRGLFILFISATLGSCAGSTANYQAPSEIRVENERTLPISFEQAWDLYVAELSKSFFVINNISKESRIINVSFQTTTPSQFIDCGMSTRTSKHPATGEQRFVYPTADSSTYNAGVDGTNYLMTVNRTANLEGRINIYMAPDDNRTLLRVNARYVWDVNVTQVSNMGQVSPNYNSTISFGSVEAGRDTEITCRSNGNLEQKLLNLI
jgi:hypothetical protein